MVIVGLATKRGGEGVSEYEDCLMCNGRDCDSSDDLVKLCDECRAEVVYLLSQRRAGEY